MYDTTSINTEAEYEAALTRIEELMECDVCGPTTCMHPSDPKEIAELKVLATAVEKYEEEHWPITEDNVIKLPRRTPNWKRLLFNKLDDDGFIE